MFTGAFDLELKSRFYNVKGIHNENFCDAGNCPRCELILKWKGCISQTLQEHTLYIWGRHYILDKEDGDGDGGGMLR